MISPKRRSGTRLVWAVVVGLFLGALFSRLAVLYMPESAARQFLTTTVSASIGPLGIDLLAIGFVIGPLSINLNVLSLVGILLVWLILRSWL
jgi:hypothetical protein